MKIEPLLAGQEVTFMHRLHILLRGDTKVIRATFEVAASDRDIASLALYIGYNMAIVVWDDRLWSDCLWAYADMLFKDGTVTSMDGWRNSCYYHYQKGTWDDKAIAWFPTEK